MKSTAPKIIRLIATLLMAGLCAPSFAADYTAPKKLVIATTYDSYPFAFVDSDGNVTGIETEIWKLWAERNHVEISFAPYAWEESLEAVRDGRADVHSGLFKTPERSEYFIFGKHGFRIDTALFVLETVGRKTLEDIGDLRIGVIAGDYTVEYLTKYYPNVELVKFIDSDSLFKALEGSVIAVFVDDVPRVLNEFDKYPLLKGKYVISEILYSNEVHFGVRKANEKLLEFIVEGMKKISAQERKTIIEKWMYYEQSNIVFRRVLMWISIGFGALLFLFLVAAFFLQKREVRIKTAELRDTLAEKETLIKKLEEALAEIKTLDGLLPMCAVCKKIRDDKGYWEQVEVYVRDRSSARFSHGICPECAKTLYSDIFTEEELNEMK